MASAGSLLTSSGLSGFAIPNSKLTATVASNELTISVKRPDDSDPSRTAPLFTTVRSNIASGEGFEGRHIVDPLTLTIPLGQHLGTQNSIPFKLWVLLFDDAGTFRLGAINCLASNLRLYPLSELVLRSAVASSGSVSAGVIVASQAVTDKPFRVVGYLEWSSGLPAFGAWSSEPTDIQLHYFGMPLPGHLVQEFFAEDSNSGSSGAAVIPADGTIPQSTEGTSSYTDTFTPSSSSNVIEYKCDLVCSYSVPAIVSVALFWDITAGGGTLDANAIAGGSYDVRAADVFVKVRLRKRAVALTTGQLTFQWRKGGSVAGTFYINRNSVLSASPIGDIQPSFRKITERMA